MARRRDQIEVARYRVNHGWQYRVFTTVQAARRWGRRLSLVFLWCRTRKERGP